MSNETVVRLTGDASGYVSEMDRARKSAADFMMSQDTLHRRLTNSVAAIDASRKALQDQGAAMVDAFNRTARSAEGWLTSLQKQADQAGKTRTQLMELRAAELGVSDAAQPYIDKIKAAEQAMNGGSHAAEKLNFSTAGARRELLVLLHEMLQGNWKNFGGSLLVLGERTDAMSMLMSKSVLTIGAFVGAIASSAAIVYHAREVLADYGEQIEILHQKTGVSTDSIQQWAFATKSVGVDTKEATKSLAGLGEAQNKAINGNKDSAKAFAAIGISLADLKKNSPDELLPKIAGAFHQSADGAAKAAVANELFGASGESLIPLLDRGRAGLDALRAAAAESGAVIGGETIAKMAALKEQMDLSKAKMDALTLSAKAQLLPTIINLTNAMTGNVAMKPLLEDFYRGVGVIMKAAASAIATVVIGFEQVSQVIATTVKVVGAATTGQFKRAADEADVGYYLLKRQGQGYADFMKKLWSDAAVPPSRKDGAPGTNQIEFAKGEKSAPKAYHDDAATRFLQQLRDQDAELRLQLATTDKLTNSEKELAKFNQQISDWRDKTLTADQKNLIGRQVEIRAQLQKNIELEKEVKHRNDITKLQERSAQIQASIASYQQGQRDQYSRELDAIGMGNEAVKNAQAVKAIYAKYQHEKEQLDKETAPDLINGEKYKVEVAKIQTGLQQSLTDFDEYYAALKEKQANWINGASTALANYMDESQNKMKQTEQLFNTVTSGMESAWVNFTQTGKLSFTSLMNSVIADLARMSAKAAISGLLGNFASIGGSLIGGFFGANAGVAAPVSSALPGDSLDNMINLTNGFGTGHADGGYITGPGSGTSDSIMARLSNGEFVVNAAATSKYRGLLEAINGKQPVAAAPRFATGGYVGSSTPVSGSSGNAMTVSIDARTTVEGGSSQGGSTGSAAELQKRITQAIRAVIQDERRQGGALWKMQNGIA
ncbi:TPA: phage tail tape measure protein [Burkholderia vietnamiensis]|uniref:phage tail tape measure protein n=1 Tax=Burkholderia vietnamiensis TaxID=60552 RepID=UPI001594D74B|nr:phage tail tape measure protein [Burkholderia vietnamiensis]MCA8212196.1 phage tail tape measure protein [Burkholderia vietnamiensis]HDR9101138.1 phage tail tape measure protein [Burkholderia vietnamiensis]HDR9122843.1 phage tail tape measure protein [Burkholderia vietnamiensis]HDR9281520.1 phage tail tape measure protein [Burkholderia vietnamiensis]